MERKGVNYENMDADRLVCNEPCLLHGVVILTSTTGGDVTVYDGRDAISGRKVMRFEGIANESRPVMFPKPLYLPGGLFVDIGTNVSEFLVIWEVAEEKG